MNFDDACGGFDIVASSLYAISESNIWRPDYVTIVLLDITGLIRKKGSHGENAWFTSGWNNRKNGWSPIITLVNVAGMDTIFRISAGDFSLLRFACYRLYKSAGTAEDDELIVTNFQTSEFAGIVCIKGSDTEEHDNSRCRLQEYKETPRMPGLPVNKCYIRAGNELWISDSTQNGTYRVADIRGGVASSNPEYLTPHEPSGKMFFAATAEPDGRELWVTDGTQKGTKLVEDIFVGEMGSNPKFLTLKK